MQKKKPAAVLPEVDLDVVDVHHIAVMTDLEGETIISLEIAGGQVMNLILSAETLSKIEAMLAKANETQAQIFRIQ
jgi:hypothetical protein